MALLLPVLPLAAMSVALACKGARHIFVSSVGSQSHHVLHENFLTASAQSCDCDSTVGALASSLCCLDATVTPGQRAYPCSDCFQS